MNRLFRKISLGVISGTMVLAIAACGSDQGTAPKDQTETAEESSVESTEETETQPMDTEEIRAVVEADVPVKEIELSQDDENYYVELLKAEVYNYKLIRNIPTAYDEASWDEYCSQANILLTLDPSEIGKTQEGLIQKACDSRKNLIQIKKLEESIMYIWDDVIPTVEDAKSLEFTLESYDNSDFKPFLVPYILDDQAHVKGNMIIIAGGGYSSRGNAGEGWPIANRFNELGYNCFVLQRRVEPYGMEDIWMDLQRSIRYIRHNAENMGIKGTECMVATGFSGGGMTINGVIKYLYGDIQPTIYVDSYVPDEVDSESADLDVACVIYGPWVEPGSEDSYEGFETDNPNLPAIFLAAGADDPLGASEDNFAYAMSVKDKTLVEYHNFENVGHGFGVGIKGTNSVRWFDLADGFIDLAMAEKAPAQEVSADNLEVPAEYTNVKVFEYPFAFGDTIIKCATNDDGTGFYAVFIAFDEEQILEGTVDAGKVTVTFDKSGFMSGDAQAIYDYALSAEAVEVDSASAGADIPEEYTKTQVIEYPFQFGDTSITIAITEDGTGFYAIFTAFEEEQILEGIVEDGKVTVTFDKSGFMSGDAQAIYDSADPEAWK